MHATMSNNPITEIKARVRQAVAESKSPASLAKRAGLHRNSLYGCDDDNWNPRADTLEKLWPVLTDQAA
jgi:3,4-dihydroxy 2-butanone 4-phosphate synthase/GTP cyclohydrolase II